MKTAEQILAEHWQQYLEEDPEREHFHPSVETLPTYPSYAFHIAAMKAYARQALEIAAEAAQIKSSPIAGRMKRIKYIDKSSITDIELP